MKCFFCEKDTSDVICQRCETCYCNECWNNTPSNRCYLCHIRIGKEVKPIDNRVECCICYERVINNLITCPRCKSVYHIECWEAAKRDTCCYCRYRLRKRYLIMKLIALLIVYFIIGFLRYKFRKILTLLSSLELAYLLTTEIRHLFNA